MTLTTEYYNEIQIYNILKSTLRTVLVVAEYCRKIPLVRNDLYVIISFKPY